jgi:hypothetical protein
LKLVVDEQGEVDPGSLIQQLYDQVSGLETEVRAWRRRYAELARDREAEAEAHKLWPAAVELFGYWKQACRHPNSAWTADRFFEVQPCLAKYGEAMCRKAIDGVAFDAYTVTRRNGSVKRFDSWDFVFKSAARLEECANRAPRR